MDLTMTYNWNGWENDPELEVNGRTLKVFAWSSRFVFAYQGWVIKIGTQSEREADLWNNMIEKKDRWAFVPIVLSGQIADDSGKQHFFVVQPKIHMRRSASIPKRMRKRFLKVVAKYNLHGDVKLGDEERQMRNASLDECDDPVIFDYGITN